MLIMMVSVGAMAGHSPLVVIQPNTKNAEISGQCAVEVKVAKTGAVSQVTQVFLSDNLPSWMKKECNKAAKKLKFKPLVVDGKVYEFDTTYVYSF